MRQVEFGEFWVMILMCNSTALNFMVTDSSRFLQICHCISVTSFFPSWYQSSPHFPHSYDLPFPIAHITIYYKWIGHVLWYLTSMFFSLMSTHWLSEALLWTCISCWPLLTSAMGVAQDARCCPLGVAWYSPYCSTEHHSSIFFLQLTLAQLQYLLIGSAYRNYQNMMLRTLSHRLCDVLLHQATEQFMWRMKHILFLLSAREFGRYTFVLPFLFPVILLVYLLFSLDTEV
jgi:hypothetical protein